jgi:hypothetical protein
MLIQGNVGIGTTGPGSKLEVNGDISTSGPQNLTGYLVTTTLLATTQYFPLLMRLDSCTPPAHNDCSLGTSNTSWD